MKTAKSVGIGISNDGKSDGSVKYREVSDLLRKEILAGKYSPGSAFPSLKIICRRFGVSYLTAVRATEALKELGLVKSQNGVGTFVKRRMMTVGLVMPMLKQVEVYPPICQEFSRLCLEKGVSIDFADISALRSDRVRPVAGSGLYLSESAALAAKWRRSPPDAVVCSSDLVAANVLKLLRRIGKRCPRDILVTGVDDVNLATLVSPTITTVRQPCAEIAATVLETLFWRFDNPKKDKRRIMLAADLVVRESTTR